MEKPNRSGKTIVTSVSVSKEFSKLIDQYDISPTECFRRGMAVILCDLGVEMYQSKKNEDRMKYVEEFMGKIEADEKLQAKFDKITHFESLLKHFAKIKKIAEEIEDDN